MPKLAAHSLSQLLQRFFCERLHSQRRVSECTISSYRDTFRLLLRFVEQRTGRAPHQQDLEDWQAPRILQFLDFLEKERRNLPRTRNARLAALRSFMRYVAQEEPSALALTAQIMAIPMKRFDRPLLGYLSRQEMEIILDTPDAARWNGRRDRVLFALLYNTGGRVSEIAALTRQDIQGQRPCLVHLHGKDRVVPLWKSTAAALQRWLAELATAPTTPVFANRFGQPLSRSGIEKRLRKIIQQATGPCPSLRGRHISPHTFRHSTAMHQLQAGVDLTVIALWLGHETPATTHQYIELDLQMKEQTLQKLKAPKATCRRFSPNDKLLTFLENL